MLFNKVCSSTAVPLVLILLLGLSGCKNKESMVPGTWSGGQGDTIEVKADKSWSAALPGGVTAEGTWSFDGKDVTITPIKLAGKPVAEMKRLMEASSAAAGPDMKKQIDDADKPDILTLSDDGKTLTTDKDKDKNSKPITLTKQG